MFYKKISEGYLLYVWAAPNAKKSEIIGSIGEPLRLKIKLNSPPVDGKANQELISFLARTLKISKSRMTLLKGQTSKFKEVLIATEEDLDAFFEKFTLVGP